MGKSCSAKRAASLAGQFPSQLLNIQCYWRKDLSHLRRLPRYFAHCALQSLLVLAACRSSPESDSGDPVQTATPQPTVTATPLRRGEYVAGRGVGRGSTKTEEGYLRIDEETAHNAIDGDSETVWSSGQHPTQWFSVALDGLYMIHSVELVTAQAPPGPTTHEACLGNATGTRTLYKRLSDVSTEDGQTLNIDIVPPRVADEVGAVYRRSGSPDLQGLFLFADSCHGRIWGLKPPQLDSQNVWQIQLLADPSVPISSVGKDEDGNIFATGYQDGVLYRLADE